MPINKPRKVLMTGAPTFNAPNANDPTRRIFLGTPDPLQEEAKPEFNKVKSLLSASKLGEASTSPASIAAKSKMQTVQDNNDIDIWMTNNSIPERMQPFLKSLHEEQDRDRFDEGVQNFMDSEVVADADIEDLENYLDWQGR